jgi:hypothetical protein
MEASVTISDMASCTTMLALPRAQMLGQECYAFKTPARTVSFTLTVGGGNIWLGYFKIVSPSTWGWYSGCNSGYSNFAAGGEGNDAAQYYAMISENHGGQWADIENDWGTNVKCIWICGADPTAQQTANFAA